MPAGFSFKDQNTFGRKNNPYYFFGDKISVTTQPLFEYLKKKINYIDIVSLETIVSDWISNCFNCKNKFYFADDGHWTALTHKKLYLYFKKNLKKIK